MTLMLAKEKWQIKTIAALELVFEERIAQMKKHGDAMRHLSDGTGPGVRWISAGCGEVVDDKGEPVCSVHDYLWPEGQSVCNGALNSFEEMGLEDGTATDIQVAFRKEYDRLRGDAPDPSDQLTRMHLVREELAETFELEGNDPRFIAEAIQVAALLVQWVEYKLEGADV
jgi:hypothetical protein